MEDGPNADFLMLRCEPEASLEARTSMAHAMYWPPLADSVEPVMKPASSEARNTTQRGDLLGLAEAADRDLRDDLRSFSTFSVDRLHHLGADVAGADRR